MRKPAKSPAVLGKLAPPRLGRVFARERLFALLDALSDHPAIWLHGAPGAGKGTNTAFIAKTPGKTALTPKEEGAIKGFIADIRDKRRVSYEQPMRDERGCKVWRRADELDSNGILDCFAVEGAMDAVETIARAYAAKGRHRTGRVGQADCHLFNAQDIVGFGKAWLEARFR